MRELRYKRYVMHCAGGIWESGTLKDLLLTIGLLRAFIPPFRIINNLLKYGVPNSNLPNGLPDGKVEYDAGMSGGAAWKPFEITQEEYEELILELLTSPNLNLQISEAPEEVETYSQWVDWQFNSLIR